MALHEVFAKGGAAAVALHEVFAKANHHEPMRAHEENLNYFSWSKRNLLGCVLVSCFLQS